MSCCPSDLTWLYDVRAGRTVRVRFDLRARVEVGTPEPWSEPASKVNDDDPVHMPQIRYRSERQRAQTRARVRRWRAADTNR